VTDPASADRVEEGVAGLGSGVLRGEAGLIELVRRDDVDMVLGAIVGSAGLPAMMAAVTAGKGLALANKESLVAAGSVLMPEARRRGVNILPVDSEHSAIFQAMASGRRAEVREVILTASGGPFRSWDRDRIRRATVAEALNHPTWRMGKKVTIDSATMFNKGLELIEACWLFDLPPGQVRIVVHPESVVHSMVEFVDGNVIAQLSPPDMRTPIQYAITYPERVEGVGRRMKWGEAMSLNFCEPDYGKFPALGLAKRVAEMGGTAGAVMNAANEAAVSAFLGGKIQFGEICTVVELTIAKHRVQGQPTLDDVLEADRWARATAAGLAETLETSETSPCPSCHRP
jgi:1-deoxy-D-xylulose-5-phosphate reductoisomerase